MSCPSRRDFTRTSALIGGSLLLTDATALRRSALADPMSARMAIAR